MYIETWGPWAKAGGTGFTGPAGLLEAPRGVESSLFLLSELGLEDQEAAIEAKFLRDCSRPFAVDMAIGCV